MPLLFPRSSSFISLQRGRLEKRERNMSLHIYLSLVSSSRLLQCLLFIFPWLSLVPSFLSLSIYPVSSCLSLSFSAAPVSPSLPSRMSFFLSCLACISLSFSPVFRVSLSCAPCLSLSCLPCLPLLCPLSLSLLSSVSPSLVPPVSLSPVFRVSLSCAPCLSLSYPHVSPSLVSYVSLFFPPKSLSPATSSISLLSPIRLSPAPSSTSLFSHFSSSERDAILLSLARTASVMVV